MKQGKWKQIKFQNFYLKIYLKNVTNLYFQENQEAEESDIERKLRHLADKRKSGEIEREFRHLTAMNEMINIENVQETVACKDNLAKKPTHERLPLTYIGYYL